MGKISEKDRIVIEKKLETKKRSEGIKKFFYMKFYLRSGSGVYFIAFYNCPHHEMKLKLKSFKTILKLF